LTVTNGHGVYVGTEWSAARTYIQGGSTTNALLEATGYQDGRGFTYSLANNATFAVPPAFVGAYIGDKDDGGNSLRKYLWDYHMPDVIRTNSSYPKVEWSAYAPVGKTPGSWDTVQIKWVPFIDAITPLGFEEVMHDVGWNESMASLLYDPVDWPLGMKVSFDYAKSKGLHVGLYLPGPQSYANVKYLFDTYGTQMWRSDGTAGYALGSPTATTYEEVRNFYQMLDALQAEVTLKSRNKITQQELLEIVLAGADPNLKGYPLIDSTTVLALEAIRRAAGEEKLLSPDVLHAITMLRRTLSTMHHVDAMEQLTAKLAKFKTNQEFINLISGAKNVD
jgi:hypothetical protein